MILLSIIVAALGVISLVCLLFVMWPPPRHERLDELEVRRRLRPDGRDVERFECADPEGDWIRDQERGA